MPECKCGCKSEYYGVSVDHFSSLMHLKAFPKKEQGPVAEWFQEVISHVNSLHCKYPHAVATSKETTLNFAANSDTEFMSGVVGYKHQVQACNSVRRAIA